MPSCIVGWSRNGLSAFLQASKLYNQANQTAADAFGACRTVAAFNLRGEIFTMYSRLLDPPEQESNKRYACTLPIHAHA